MRTILQIIETQLKKKQPRCRRTKPRSSSAMLLPPMNDCSPFVIVATPTELSLDMCAATIQGWLLFLSLSSRCGYYSRAATIRGPASIRINTVNIANLSPSLRPMTYFALELEHFVCNHATCI